MSEIHGPREDIVIEDTATNEDKILYTVPANKILYLQEASLCSETTINGHGKLSYRNDSDVHIRFLCHMRYETAVGSHISDHFVAPHFLKILEGYDIMLHSSAIGLTIEGNFSGFLVDV